MSRMSQNNLALIVTRQLSLPTFQHAFTTRAIIDGNTISLQTREYNYLFPLYQCSEHSDQRSLSLGESRITNLSADFLAALKSHLNGTSAYPGVRHNGSPEIIFGYIYAVLQSATYRTRYAEFLKIDFPRIPLTSSLDLFHALAKLGGELVALHLLEFEVSEKVGRGVPAEPPTAHPEGSPYLKLTEYIGDNRVVGKVGWTEDQGGTVWIDGGGTKNAFKPGTSGFAGVPSDVWQFHIGGYQVCEKWLKDRKDRTLSDDDLTHYHKIVVALSETIRLMAEIDQVIEQHGGWPGAFAGSES